MATIAPWLQPADALGAMRAGAGLGLQISDMGQRWLAQQNAVAAQKWSEAASLALQRQQLAQNAFQFQQELAQRKQQSDAALALQQAQQEQMATMREATLQNQSERLAQQQASATALDEYRNKVLELQQEKANTKTEDITKRIRDIGGVGYYIEDDGTLTPLTERNQPFMNVGGVLYKADKAGNPVALTPPVIKPSAFDVEDYKALSKQRDELRNALFFADAKTSATLKEQIKALEDEMKKLRATAPATAAISPDVSYGPPAPALPPTLPNAVPTLSTNAPIKVGRFTIVTE